MGNKISDGFSKIRTKANRKRTSETPSTSVIHSSGISSPSRELPPIPTPTSTKVIVRALYDFAGVSDDDLSFKKGDKLEIEHSNITDQEDWWLARHTRTNATGYIPSNYVVKADESPQSQDWWYNLDRHEAERRLLLPGHKTGTFLIRPAGDNLSYVLSVLDLGTTKGCDPTIKHYRIKTMDNGDFYISTNRQFKDLAALITFYQSKNSTGLCCPLHIPCPRMKPIPIFDELEVKRDAVLLTTKLGAGCFGEVWKGKLHKVLDVAVKQLKKDSMSSEAFLDEARIMHKLYHDRIVRLLGVVLNAEPFLIITELMIHGALLDFLHSEAGKKLKFSHLISMNSQIAEGMAFLEVKGYIHRDLRAANILVGEQYCVKIADLGLARSLKEDVYNAHQDAKFPIKWTAPEAAHERKFTTKSDVWSFGVLMYEIITFGKVPYPGMNGSEVLRMIERGERMAMPAHNPIPIPVQYYELMKKCWHQNPEDRPTFESLHDLFDNYTISTEEQYL
ncbi:proto-oncogene tyrosine-protein kinase LCK [Biomphalaria pfeifferi]|uniref:Tyrosine-protein kinase n=1 Tax=Biomphalaria pfeifferi TaxID=112525 RepID=A0AAD8ATB8_BIOPF|nr:proto-oncogene tyrosine-protein kinase LCK [Biomphalaria pfeifferi]